MQTIALLGLGAMGTAMARRWRAAGFPLRLCNRTPSKAAALAEIGAVAAATPAEAAAGADVIISMVADDEASRAVWFGSDGALAGLKAGAVAIEQSTLSPAFIRALATAAAATGADFLDAPVGGGPPVAAAGKLVVFAGGEAAVLDRVRPVLAAIAERIEHVGGVGAGATWKLINYMIAGAQVTSLAEGLALARRAGIPLARAGELLRQGVVASPVVLSKLPRMVEGRFADAEAPLRLVAKDQRYTLDLAGALGARLDLQPVVAGLFARAERQGLGDLDVAAIFEAIEAAGGNET
ncbi:MAG: NAD(P)-dependent oxidoreductase [Parvularculaceae bacterium]